MVNSDRNAGVAKGGKIILYALGSIILVALLWWGASTLIDQTPGMTAANPGHKINSDGTVGKIASVALGIAPAKLSIESIILHLVVLIMIIFVLADLILFASTFSDTTAWIVSISLGIILNFTGITAIVVAIFGIAAGLSALGIAIIILAAVFSMVILNLGLGGALRRWRWMRQAEIDEAKTAKGANAVAESVKGLKKVKAAFSEGEEI